MQTVRLDLNQPEFQEELFELPKEHQRATLNTLQKVSRMTWTQVYGDRGLKWEAVLTRRGPKGQTIYSFRCSRAFRALGYRQGDFLVLLSLHPDHDSAYR